MIAIHSLSLKFSSFSLLPCVVVIFAIALVLSMYPFAGALNLTYNGALFLNSTITFQSFGLTFS